ncbi:mevalonate kinase [Brevibacterium oceani]|uniref:mevalonate kinase n=1 Tax=Brevibacterium oceani TaxID=358099 RepID=UPI001B3437FD|nr:mevalonate kinase [Brevibacterium oceani]
MPNPPLTEPGPADGPTTQTQPIVTIPDAQGHSHAKAILFGEHAVVYGAPALAVPLHGLGVQADLFEISGPESRIESQLFSGTVSTAPAGMGPVVAALEAAFAATADADGETKNGADSTNNDSESGHAHPVVELRIRSGIPHSRGLGSSAAVATAIARAVANLRGVDIDAAALHGIVQTAETVAHGRPSGIDAWAVAADWPIRFQNHSARPIEVGSPLVFVLADSGRPGSTAQAVGGVRARHDADPVRVGAMIDRLAALSEAAVDDIRAGDRVTIGHHMLEAHELLGSLGVSTPTLDSLVDAATAAGAKGAKLTGGGLGGCVLALADGDEAAEELADAMRAAGAPRTWTTEVRPT